MLNRAKFSKLMEKGNKKMAMHGGKKGKKKKTMKKKTIKKGKMSYGKK